MSGAFPGQPDQSTAATGLGSVHVVGRGLGGGGRAGAAPPRDRLGTLPGRSKSWFEPRREQTKLTRHRLRFVGSTSGRWRRTGHPSWGTTLSG